jgi:hypothetical protein
MPARKRAAGKAAVKRTAVKKTPKKTAPAMAAKRKDLGAPVGAYFAQQPPEKRALLEKLRALVAKGVPDADASIKWGVPFYQRKGKNVCSLAAFKEHVGINFFASPDVLVDPGNKLEGGGKSMRMLKVRRTEDIDNASILRWLKATVAANSA